MKDPRIKKYMGRLRDAWRDGTFDAFVSTLDEIRLDGTLTQLQRRAVVKTLAQHQSAIYSKVMQKRGDG